MANVTYGDLAMTHMLQRQSVNLRTQMARLSEELASGQTADVREVLAGNFSYLNDIERDIRTLQGYRVSGTEALQFVEVMDLHLERISNVSNKMGNDLIALATLPAGPILEQGANEARELIDQIFAELNAEIAGRSIFSGTATDQNAVADYDIMLTALEAAVGGATTPADIRAAAETWFNDPAGFDAVVYTGSTDALAPFRMSQTESVSVDVRADDPILKQIIMNLAIVAISDSAALGYPGGVIKDLQFTAGSDLIGRQQEITAMRGSIGTVMERIEEINARSAAERATLDLAKADFLAIDPFEAATRLEDVQFRLNSLYAVTARNAELTLVNFLR